LSETIEWAWSVPPSAVRAQGFTRIDDFARHVKQVRAKRAELRKQRPDPLRRGILDMLEPILLDCPYIQKAAVREAGVHRNPQFHVWWGGGKPHVYNDVRANSGRYYPKRNLAVPAAWLLARLGKHGNIATRVRDTDFRHRMLTTPQWIDRVATGKLAWPETY